MARRREPPPENAIEGGQGAGQFDHVSTPRQIYVYCLVEIQRNNKTKNRIKMMLSYCSNSQPAIPCQIHF